MRQVPVVLLFTTTGKLQALPWCAASPFPPMLLLLSLQGAIGATLDLQAPDSEIRIGNAALSMRCAGNNAPSVRSFWPVNQSSSHNVTAHLLNVPATCSHSAITEPCASIDPRVPALWFCAWSPTAGGRELLIGPVGAVPQEEVLPSGTVIGIQAVVFCNAPDVDVPTSYVVSLRHGADVPIQFVGLSGGDVVTILPVNFPPPTTPPLAPPRPPPHPPPLSPPLPASLAAACSAKRADGPTSMKSMMTRL